VQKQREGFYEIVGVPKNEKLERERGFGGYSPKLAKLGRKELNFNPVGWVKFLFLPLMCAEESLLFSSVLIH